MKRILITGVSGFLGWHVALHLQGRHEVLGTYREHAVMPTGCAAVRLDLADAPRVHALCREFRPEVVVHAAALADVDRCEQDSQAAYRVNVQGTALLAEAVSQLGARFIYISTDQVYDGAKGNYAETDEPRPPNVYGRTKLEGERTAAANCAETVVLRLALMYGWGTAVRATFTDWLVARLRARQAVPLFIDQYRTPLFVVQAADVIGRLSEHVQVAGVFNLGGGERLDRYTFGIKFCEVFGLPTQYLTPVSMHTIRSAGARPPDCSLNSAKISALLHITPLAVQEGVQAMKQQRPGG